MPTKPASKPASPKRKPCRMWANRFPKYAFLRCYPTKREAREADPFRQAIETGPVAIIPLDDVEALVCKVAKAFGGDSGFYDFTSAREALRAIGVLPRARKGRK